MKKSSVKRVGLALPTALLVCKIYIVGMSLKSHDYLIFYAFRDGELKRFVVQCNLYVLGKASPDELLDFYAVVRDFIADYTRDESVFVTEIIKGVKDDVIH